MTPVNDSPILTSDGGTASANVNAVENQTSVTTVTATDADVPPDTLTFSIAGGADAALFSINSSTGVLSFNTPLDFDNPTDANSDGIYEVTVQVDDGNGGLDTQAISVTAGGLLAPPPLSPDPESIPDPESDTDPESGAEGDAVQSGQEASGYMTSVVDSQEGDSSGGSNGLAQKTMSLPPGRGNEPVFPAMRQQMKGEGLVDIVSEALDLMPQPFELTDWASDIQTLLSRSEFLHDLDRVREAFNEVETTEKINIASSIAASTGLSVGYVIWLIRSGALLSTLLSSLPAWQLVNPVNVLAVPAKKKRRKDGDDLEDDSIESMFVDQTSSPDTSDDKAKADLARKARKARFPRRT